jgi:GMP synthase-like glutamine amidotransferase
MRPVRLLIVQHDDTAGLGTLEAPLRARGADLDDWWPTRGETLPAPLETYDGLVVLGGFAHPDQDAEHPWLAADRAVLQEALDVELPTLGICLGSQLLAQVAGGRAVRMPRPEIGWFEIRLAVDAHADPLLAGLDEGFCALVWHHYGVELPDDVPVLGRTDRATQAFRVGRQAWGLQFHVEADAGTVDAWTGEAPDEVEVAGGGVEALRRETTERVDGYIVAAHELADRFADVVERRLASLGSPATAGG